MLYLVLAINKCLLTTVSSIALSWSEILCVRVCVYVSTHVSRFMCVFLWYDNIERNLWNKKREGSKLRKGKRKHTHTKQTYTEHTEVRKRLREKCVQSELFGSLAFQFVYPQTVETS